VEKTAVVVTREDTLLNFVRSVKGAKKLSFEEGVMSQWLYALLKDEVEELVVCQPPEKHGAKTDRIDATEIADLLRVGRLKSVFHAENDLYHLRTLVSGYEDAIEDLTRTKNRYKALYRQIAIPTGGTNFYSSEDMIEKLDTDVRRHVASAFFAQMRLIEKQVEEYRERFAINAKKYNAIQLLTSIPGIGPVRANQIVAVMVTPHRFPDKYHLFSYAMLTHHTRQSDGKLYGTRRPVGQTILKKVFKSAVLSATQSNTAFRRRYEDKRRSGADDHVARSDVARMIAATVYGVWKSGKKYDDHHMEVTRRRNQSCHSGT
jgi:transposase